MPAGTHPAPSWPRPAAQANNDGYGLGATLLSKRKVPKSWVVAK
jgi:hypothetical protein